MTQSSVGPVLQGQSQQKSAVGCLTPGFQAQLTLGPLGCLGEIALAQGIVTQGLQELQHPAVTGLLLHDAPAIKFTAVGHHKAGKQLARIEVQRLKGRGPALFVVEQRRILRQATDNQQAIEGVEID